MELYTITRILKLTEMAYPLFKDSNMPFKVISFDKIIHRVNPIAPRYLENEESVNEVSRVLIENLLEQRESGTTGTTKFFNDAAEGLIGGLIWKLKTDYPNYCTLPHLIAIYQMLDTDSLIQFLETNTTSRAMADAFISGKDSDRQTAGVKKYSGKCAETNQYSTDFYGIVRRRSAIEYQ